jgi:hypothetical protein
MENLVIFIVRLSMWAVIIAAPIIGFISGGYSGGALGPFAVPSAHLGGAAQFNIVTAIAGGVTALIVAAFVFGIIAILLQIEGNTRRR